MAREPVTLPRLLQNGRLMPRLEEGLARAYDVHPLWREADAPAFLRARGPEFTGLVTSAGVGAPRALLEALPALRVVASFGVGYDTIDLETARRRGIAVSTTPDVLTDCVADLAVGLLVAVMRGIVAGDRFVRRGAWLAGKYPLTTRVSGKRLGIVGLGRIGRAVARRAAGFDLELAYHGRRPAAGAPFRFEPSLVELARWADALVLSCAGGPETRHLVSAEVLDALGPEGFLVNVARGSVVDEAALVRVLEERRIAGAALDVFEDEPRVPDALLRMENVVLLPHVASGTEETRAAMAELVLENLRTFYAAGRLVTPLAL
jgi:lactate dehydrogenase-like 2-hydroxyacid dehydrogenase